MNDNRTSTPQITTQNCGPFSFSLIWLAQRTFDILTFEDKFQLASHTIDVVFPTLCSWDCLEVLTLVHTLDRANGGTRNPSSRNRLNDGNRESCIPHVKKKRREAIPDTQYFTYISINGVLDGRHSPYFLAISKIQIKSNSVIIKKIVNKFLV
jgi:hypothetical protein